VDAANVPFFAAGTWSLSGEGGLDLSPFRFNFRLPPPQRVINREALSVVRRDRDLTIVWNPNGYGPGDMVSPSAGNASGAIYCREHAWTGFVTISRTLLGQLSPTDTPGAIYIDSGPEAVSREQFSLARPAGEPVRMIVTYGFGDNFEAEFQ
jgi:hypothetical protein